MINNGLVLAHTWGFYNTMMGLQCVYKFNIMISRTKTEWIELLPNHQVLTMPAQRWIIRLPKIGVLDVLELVNDGSADMFDQKKLMRIFCHLFF